MADIVVNRTAHNRHYLQVSNTMARNELPTPLHAVARCLLMHLLSLPTGWTLVPDRLHAAFAEGRDAVRRGLEELEEAGYLHRDKHRDTAGKWRHTWTVTENPQVKPQTENQALETSTWTDQGKHTFPQVKPGAGNPAPVNQALLEDGSKKTEYKQERVLHSPGCFAPGLTNCNGECLDKQEENGTTRQLAAAQPPF